jgi:hypothetical protein
MLIPFTLLKSRVINNYTVRYREDITGWLKNLQDHFDAVFKHSSFLSIFLTS